MPCSHSPSNPPRCRRADETAKQYRVAMGWDDHEDERPQCKACFGKGWNDEFHAVAGHYSGGETFRMECEACDGSGLEGPNRSIREL
jgi:DnaJ-class molecular chaperone